MQVSFDLRDKDAAKFLGLSVPTIRRMRANGAGPKFARLPGGGVRYCSEHLAEWLRGRIVDPEARS
jgi:predicted DNA-binding transcriptional regulator AlpA